MKKLFIYLLIFAMNSFAQTTITIYENGKRSVVRYINSDGNYDYTYGTQYQIGRKDGTNGIYSGSQEDIYRTEHSFLLSSIPQNATVTQVKLVSFFGYYTCNTCDLKVTETDGTGAYGTLWSNIANGTTLISNIQYGTSQTVSTSLKNAVIAANRGAFYIGSLSQNENGNLSDASLELRLEITYTVPPSSVSITADNNFTASGGANHGSIKVDGASQTAPYTFSRNTGTSVSLQSVTPQNDNQSHQMIWYTGSVNKSEWKKNGTSLGAYNQTYSFTVSSSDNNATYQANLKKNYEISRSEQTEFDGTSSAGVIAHIVEQNSGNISAPSSKTVNGKSYLFSYWTDNSSSSNPRSVAPTDNTTYTAYYKEHLYTNSSTATTTNSQRKIVQNSSGDWAMVYTSSDKIWLSRSTDGTNWDGEKLISDNAQAFVYGYPSIGILGNIAYIVWQGIDWAGGTGFDAGAIFMRSYDLSNNSLGSIVTVANFTPNIQAFLANPAISTGITNDEKMIAWRESNGLKVRYYDNYDGWSNVTSVTGTNSSSYNPSIADYNGYVYVLCWEDNANHKIKFTKATYSQTISFSTVEEVSPSNWESNGRPQIVMGYLSKPTVVWASRNNVTEGGPAVHVRQKSSISGTWGTITSFSYSSGSDLSPVIGNYSSNGKMDVLWNIGNTVYKGSYNGSSWSGPSTVTTSGGTGVNINQITPYQTKAVWKKSDNTIAFYNIGGTAPPKMLASSENEETPLAYRLNRHAIIELRSLSVEASAKVEGSVCFEIAGISTVFKNTDMKINYSQDTLNLLSSEPFKVEVPGMELKFRGAIYGKGLEVSNNFISSLNEPLAKVVLKNSKTGEVLKDVWTNSPSMLNSVRNKTFGEFRATNVNLNNFLGKTVYVEVQMLGKAKGVEPIIVNDYYILSDSVGSQNNLNKTALVYDLPSDYTLMQNYPNPFNPSTTISFYLPKNDHVMLKIFNTLGKEIMTAVNENMEEGYHAVNLNMQNEPSGIYFYTLTAGSYTNTKKLLLLK